jgi:hypothetical protein
VRVRPVAIIWCAVALHALWGCLLLVDGQVRGATSISAFAGVPRMPLAAVFFAVSVAAAAGVTSRRGTWLRLALLLPQQAVLSVSAVSAITAVILSRYGDGVERPWHFILADQAPMILTVVLHTIAVVQLHLPRRATADLAATVDAVRSKADRLRAMFADKAMERAAERPHPPPRRDGS